MEDQNDYGRHILANRILELWSDLQELRNATGEVSNRLTLNARHKSWSVAVGGEDVREKMRKVCASLYAMTERVSPWQTGLLLKDQLEFRHEWKEWPPVEVTWEFTEREEDDWSGFRVTVTPPSQGAGQSIEEHPGGWHQELVFWLDEHDAETSE